MEYLNILRNPKSFYNSTYFKKQNFKQVLLFLIVILFICFLIRIIYIYLFRPEISVVNFGLGILNIFSVSISNISLLPRIILISLLTQIYIAISLLIYIPLIHGFTKLFNNKADFLTTFKIVVFSFYIAILFVPIMHINLIVAIYSLFLLIFGLYSVYKINIIKIFLIILLSSFITHIIRLLL